MPLTRLCRSRFQAPDEPPALPCRRGADARGGRHFVARLAGYGDFPSADSIVWPALSGASLALLLIALNLATSIFFKNQRAVAGIALSVGMIIPGLVAAFWPAAFRGGRSP